MNRMTPDRLRTPLQANANAAAADADVLSYALVESGLGAVLVARSANGVCAILIGGAAADLAADCAGRFPDAILVQSDGAVAGDAAKVLRYIDKPSEGLDLALDMRGTPFQRRVWEQVLTITAGETATYADVARKLTPPSHPRAVARACAANPIALAVPCHRVVRSDGDLAGYRWGLARKRDLIRKEAMA